MVQWGVGRERARETRISGIHQGEGETNQQREHQQETCTMGQQNGNVERNIPAGQMLAGGKNEVNKSMIHILCYRLSNSDEEASCDEGSVKAGH